MTKPGNNTEWSQLSAQIFQLMHTPTQLHMCIPIQLFAEQIKIALGFDASYVVGYVLAGTMAFMHK